MGFFDSFFGNSQRRDLRDAYNNSSSQLKSGYDEGSAEVRNWTNQGLGYLDNYRQSGERANALYGRFLGMDGADAQRQAMSTYATSDPFRQFNDDNSSRMLSRRFNAMGMGDSGASRLAIARAGMERGSQDYGNHMSRLAGYGQQGFGAAQTSAGIASGAGNALGQMRYGYGQQQAGNTINYGNALAASRNQGWQNALNLAGVAAKAYAGMG